MAEKILNTRILLKYDTLANWELSTGILRAGEVAIATVPEGSAGKEVGSVVTPQVLVKVGDGKHTFAKLPYITAKAGDVYAWAKAEKLGVDAFGTDVQELFTNIENDITALEGKVGNSNVADQISAAVKAAIEGLDVTDAEVAGQFVVAVPQADGKVAPARRVLAATDIPELAQDKITGLTTRLGNIETAIEDINDTEDGILAQAEAKVTALANGAVAANTAAIGVINSTDATKEGSLAKTLADAKAYTDGQVSNAKTELQGYADQAEADALAEAKKYVDAEIEKVTGDGEGSLGELEGRVAANEAALGIINSTDATKEGSLAKVAKDAADAVAAEKKRAEDAELLLDGRLDTVEAFFEAALEDGDGQQVIDTLKEIQEYIKADETGAAGMLASIKANTDALEVINSTDATKEGSLAKVVADAAKDVDNEENRAKGEEERIEGLANAAQGAADAAQDAADAADEKAQAAHDAIGAKTDAATAETVYGAIAAEKARAEGKEAELAQDIADETTNREAAVKAINDKIGAEALTGEHTTLIAAINAANAGVADNADEIGDIKEQLAGITGDEGILGQANAYTDAEIVKVNNTITALDGAVVKTVEGDDVIKASIANNKLTIDFDDTLTFVFNCGTSANLDPAQA